MGDSTRSAPFFQGAPPSDSVKLDPRPQAIYVGTGGDIVAIDTLGRAATFLNVPNGSILPIQPDFIMATGTTASGLVALYN